MAIRFLSVVVLIVFFAPTASTQQMFKWKDKKGQWHFSDTPPRRVTAEKVRGLDISPRSSPATSPYSKPSVSSHAGSGSKEKAVPKLPTERTSNTPQTGLASRWLLLLGDGNPWESFDSAETCARYREIMIVNTTQSVRFSAFSASGLAYSPYLASHCTSSDAFKSSKEADVIVVLTQVGRDQSGVIRYIMAGRVFNRGETTAKNVVVKYQARNARGTTVRKGEIRTVPHDIAGLTSAEYRSPISGGADFSGLSIRTEVDWSKK